MLTMAPKKFFNYKENKPWAQNLHIVVQLGLTMAGCIIFCLFVGLFLDNWLGTSGIFTTLFILFGIIGGGMVAYRQIMEIVEPEKRNDAEEEDSEQDDES